MNTTPSQNFGAPTHPSEELERRVKERTADLEFFVRSAGHDLQAPLRAIGSYAEMLRQRHSGNLDAEGRRIVGIICDEAEGMPQLLQGLVEFARVGARPLAEGRVDMAAAVRSVYEGLASRAAGRRMELRLGPLPPACGDPVMLRQVLVNLLCNALKFTRERDIALIEVSGRRVEGMCEYCIRDNGVGFEAERAGKLFRPFERLHPTDQYEGSGLGLVIAQRAIQRHGGRMWAQGWPQQGAAFYFSISCANRVEVLEGKPGGTLGLKP